MADVEGLVRVEGDTIVVRRPDGITDARWARLREQIQGNWDERVRELTEGRHGPS